jgi:hypothetical protein
VIRTDQKSLVHLEEQRLTIVLQQKAFTKLLGLQYRISYHNGTDNRAADALSRCQHDTHVSLSAISICRLAWLDDIKASYATDTSAKRLMTKLQQGPDAQGRFSVDNGILYFRGRIWLGGAPNLQEQMMIAFHSSTVGGHSGFPVTYTRWRRIFAWPKMKAIIKKFVQSCLTCPQAKPE